ncbi:MAG: hypothetical protein WCG26_10620 [Chloroflexales bacterium]
MCDDLTLPTVVPPSSGLDPAPVPALRRIACCLARPTRPAPSVVTQLRRAAVLATWLQAADQAKAQRLVADQAGRDDGHDDSGG